MIIMGCPPFCFYTSSFDAIFDSGVSAEHGQGRGEERHLAEWVVFIAKSDRIV